MILKRYGPQPAGLGGDPKDRSRWNRPKRNVNVAKLAVWMGSVGGPHQDRGSTQSHGTGVITASDEEKAGAADKSPEATGHRMAGWWCARDHAGASGWESIATRYARDRDPVQRAQRNQGWVR